MQPEFYRSQTELVPTFSLLIAVSLAGLCIGARAFQVNAAQGAIRSTLPASARHSYYGPAERTPDAAEQAAALGRFAAGLVAATEDNPQAVVEILNRHFWDLV